MRTSKDHALPGTSSECLVHPFRREKVCLTKQTKRSIKNRANQDSAKSKFINHDIRSKFLLAKLLLQASILIIIPSQMEVAPLHCTVDITQKRSLSKNTKKIENM